MTLSLRLITDFCQLSFNNIGNNFFLNGFFIKAKTLLMINSVTRNCKIINKSYLQVNTIAQKLLLQLLCAYKTVHYAIIYWYNHQTAVNLIRQPYFCYAKKYYGEPVPFIYLCFIQNYQDTIWIVEFRI